MLYSPGTEDIRRFHDKSVLTGQGNKSIKILSLKTKSNHIWHNKKCDTVWELMQHTVGISVKKIPQNNYKHLRVGLFKFLYFKSLPVIISIYLKKDRYSRQCNSHIDSYTAQCSTLSTFFESMCWQHWKDLLQFSRKHRSVQRWTMKNTFLIYPFQFLLLEISLAGDCSKKEIWNHTIFGRLLFKLRLRQEALEKMQLACDVQQVIQHDQMYHVSSKPLITVAIKIILYLSQAFFLRCKASIWARYLLNLLVTCLWLFKQNLIPCTLLLL